MKIDIVTSYGSNSFDLGVSEVTSLIQKAYEYSEKNKMSISEESAHEESLQKVVAAAWGVVADKEKEKVAQDNGTADTADKAAQKGVKKSRNESLFGTGWRESIPVDSEQRDYARNAEGYKGFLYIKCPDCGKIKGFCTKESINTYKCDCGHELQLKNLKPMYVHCDCGKDYRYFTNMDEERFEYKCLNCGSIVDIQINTRDTAYVTDRKLSGGVLLIITENMEWG